MRINVYAEELTNRVEIVSKLVEGNTFTGLRFWLALPVTQQVQTSSGPVQAQIKGPFLHGPDDDDSAAITFWSDQPAEDLASLLDTARAALRKHLATLPKAEPGHG